MSVTGIDIEVTHPKTVQNSGDMRPHVEYEIWVYRDGTLMNPGAPKAARRYRDFLWLISQLQKDIGGACLPVLPEKSVVNVIGDKVFQKQRGKLLSDVLKRLVYHPEVLASDDAMRHVMVFLTGSAEDFVALKDPKRNAAAAAPVEPKKRGSVSGMFSGMSSSFGSSWYSKSSKKPAEGDGVEDGEEPVPEAPAAVAEEWSEEDTQLATILNEAAVRQSHMEQVEKAVGELVTRGIQYSTESRAFGFALLSLRQEEEEAMPGASHPSRPRMSSSPRTRLW